ncbi:hypothetical protein [Frigoriglobus tundricola]|uniref:Uncharacterized protein n=1 Tax=Frigoriglobus tundricola TaxID=2774151 RepID=A0A6M5YIY0_9BACT|nr:hypothetical protein [Frigoriglobus tundricola]QJW93955.1 hypothetical protein FTUN_1472 [Frigoriglobus tundricola]
MPLRLAATAVLALFVAAAPARAAGAEAGARAPLFAGYWANFLEHWTGVFQKQNGVVMGALFLGAVCLFIITRGKWRK